jgi:hypothetical protein
MYPESLKKESTEFEGAWSRTDVYHVPGNHALFSQNVAYIKGQVSKRFGHTVVFNPADAASSMFNWLSLSGNFLVWYKPGSGVRLANLASPSAALIMTQATAAGASFADAGSRLYAAFYDSHGNGGVAGAQVYGATYGAADSVMAAPLPVSPSVTQPGAGLITVGPHRIGYLLQTRSGYVGPPGPASATNVFIPVTFTAVGLKNITVAFTNSYPIEASQVQIIMTPTNNLNDYRLVPGATALIAGPGPQIVTVTISISDEDLLAQGPSALPYQNLLANPAVGGVAIKPSVMFPYLERMIYIATDGSGFPVAYASNTNAYQQITADQNFISLPGNRQIITGFGLRGVLYLVGPQGTYSTSDNGQTPSNWPSPQLVDGVIGVLGPNCVFVNNAQGFAWVAHTSGLYLFLGGQYPTTPVSYYNDPDWQRINWNAPANVFVVDDTIHNRVEVLAPLDGATTPTHRLVWDYTDGIDPTQVKFSINSIASGYPYGCFAIVQNASTARKEVWCGSSSAGAIVRQSDETDAHPYRDIAVAINQIYELPLQPGQDSQHGLLHYHHGGHARIKGIGTCLPNYFALDHVFSLSPPNITLMVNPGKEELIYAQDIPSEHVSLQLQNSDLDGYFLLSKYTHYYAVGPTMR